MGQQLCGQLEQLGLEDLQTLSKSPKAPRQQTFLSCPTPQSSMGWAAASFLLATVIVIAVAVPVAAARPSGLDSAQVGKGRQLEAAAVATANSRAARQASAARAQQGAEPECMGISGLCKVPVRLVTFPGTHNSNAIKTTFASVAEHQQLTFAEQLQAGGRLFDLDYAGGRFGDRFGHCLGCFCAFSMDDDQNDPAKVFKVMADFLAANPREVIVIGLSNINCGDKQLARMQLLGILAASSLLKYVATTPIGPNTRLGELVDSNQRAVLLFYDEWVTPTGHTIGGKFVPNQALWRIYGGGVAVDGKDAATIDRQTSQGLLNDVINQIGGQQPAVTVNTPWRVMGLFPSSCLVCRTSGVCGPISCATKANSESFVMYIQGKATARWTRNRSNQGQLVPAFNGFQIDYLQPVAQYNVVTAARKLNSAIAWMYVNQAGQAAALGLGNCAWVLDDTAAAGGLACAGNGNIKVQSLLGLPNGSSGGGRRHLLQQQTEAGNGSKRHLLVPANPALTVRIFGDGKLRKEVKGLADKAQLLDLSVAATDLVVKWA